MPFDGVDFVSTERLRKLDAVIELVGSPDKWCKGTLRTGDGRYCLRGAIMAAGGAGLLEEPILQAIRDVTGRRCRRIEAFNDDLHTQHDLIRGVLTKARENIAAGSLTEPPRSAFGRVCSETRWATLRWRHAVKSWLGRPQPN